MLVPKEAIHHAIMRQNYGCTHIIIGRDHAGVGKFYDPFAAQKIFDDYPELEISPVFFPPFFYCRNVLHTQPQRHVHMMMMQKSRLVELNLER